MNYYINPETFAGAFPIPMGIVDNHLKLAKPEHIKVILYIYRNMSNDVSIEDISNATGVDEYDINEAFMYWEDAGLLIKKNATVLPKPKNEKPIVARDKKPTRADIAKRGLEDPKIRHLLNEAQFKFGRGLKSNESSTLVWLCDDRGLDVSIILIILQLAAEEHGLGSCWVHIKDRPHLKDDPSAGTAEQWLTENLPIIPEGWSPLCVVAVGYPEVPAKPHAPKDDSDKVLWIDPMQAHTPKCRA